MPDIFAGRRRVPRPENDPNLSYAPGTAARAELKSRLSQMASETVDIPVIIGGKEIRTGATEPVVMPHKHGHVLAHYHKASEEHVRQVAGWKAKAERTVVELSGRATYVADKDRLEAAKLVATEVKGATTDLVATALGVCMVTIMGIVAERLRAVARAGAIVVLATLAGVWRKWA